MLRAIIGGPEANDIVVRRAIHSKSLIIDCANVCDPYRYPDIEPEAFEDTYVIGFDMLTSLPDALNRAPFDLERLGIRNLAITSSRRLFTYHSKDEDASIHARAWTLMKRLSERYDVIVAVESAQAGFARAYSDHTENTMGHTVSSQRRVVQDITETLKRYRRALRAEDRERFDKLTSIPFGSVASISYASSTHTWALYLLSIILEHERDLERVRGRETQRALVGE